MADDGMLRLVVGRRANGQCECECTMLSCTHHMYNSRCASPITGHNFKLHKHGPTMSADKSPRLSRIGEGAAYALCDTCFDNWMKLGLQP